MTKFRVSVHGRNFQIGIAKKRLFRTEYFSETVGFYATRFVEAPSANEAIEIVFSLLGSELEMDGGMTPEPKMELEEIREDEMGFDMYAPGGGYTFYCDAVESSAVNKA